jgi:tetraacyldisaccharide 4'-kinase
VTDRRQLYLDIVSGRRRGPVAAVARAALWLGRFPYGAATAGRNLLYDTGLKTTHGVGVPVVVVGNLSTGGTGKTPCVEYVARHFRERGMAVAILSRGYGVDSGPNDEALVLEENLPDVPHLQGADRVALARTAVEELESELLVLDDGFQHRRLRRDLDIVLLDATRSVECLTLLPRGPLREPLSSLKRAQIAILTRCDQVAEESLARQRDFLARRFPHLRVAEGAHAPLELVGTDGRTADLSLIEGRPALGFCGLGNPDAFRTTLAHLGADLREFVTFPDHHPYTRDDVGRLRSLAAKLPAGGLALTTQKDSVKLRLPDLAGVPLWAVRVGLKFIGGEGGLRAALDGLLPTGGDAT